MIIKADWKNPIKLEDGGKNNQIYAVNTEKISENGGCYVFYNKHGNSYSVLYIGKAENLQRRIEQQFNNLKLMMGIKKSIKGTKFIMCCDVPGKNKAKKFKRTIKMLEKQLIKSATLEGHELLNQKGIKIKYNQILFKGNRESEEIFGRKMNIS